LIAEDYHPINDAIKPGLPPYHHYLLSIPLALPPSDDADK